jgi:hypothetical protein
MQRRDFPLSQLITAQDIGDYIAGATPADESHFQLLTGLDLAGYCVASNSRS